MRFGWHVCVPVLSFSVDVLVAWRLQGRIEAAVRQQLRVKEHPARGEQPGQMCREERVSLHCRGERERETSTSLLLIIYTTLLKIIRY